MLKRELKLNLKSLLIWSMVLVSLFLLVFSVYPSIVSDKNVDAINEMMKVFPKDVLEVFNMDIASMSSAFGWFQTEGMTFLLLIGGLFAGILGATILTKEESDKTIEYLYSKPITRNKIVTSKILCGIINILTFNLIITLFNLIALKISGDIDLKLFLMISLSPLIVHLVLFFVSLFISNFFTKTKKTMSLAVALVFISFFLQIIGNMSDKIKVIKYFSVFEILPARNIILNNKIDIIRLIIALTLMIVFGILTYIRYNRKELV